MYYYWIYIQADSENDNSRPVLTISRKVDGRAANIQAHHAKMCVLDVVEITFVVPEGDA